MHGRRNDRKRNSPARETPRKPTEHNQLPRGSREALIDSEGRFRELFENTYDIVYSHDLTGNFGSINKAGQRITGYTREEILTMNIEQVLTPESLEVARRIMDRKLAGEETVSYEAEIVAKDGRRVPVEISNQLIHRKGKPIQVQVIARDLSERKWADEQIRRQVRLLTALRHVDLAITASADLRVNLSVLLDQVTAQLHIDAADVLLLNPQTQTLEYAAGRGFRTAALQDTRLRLGQGHAGRAALERRIISILNLIEDPGDFVRSPSLPGEEFVAYFAAPLIAKGQVKGVLEIFHRASVASDREWLEFLEALASQAALAIDNATLFDSLQSANAALTLAYDTTLEGWVRALDLRDKETEGHSQRVTELTLRLAPAMGVSDEALVHIRRGALLHDIGKLGVPDSVLLKPGPLSDEEWEIMRRHPVYAYELLSPITYLHPALDIPYCHHEKWDGTGYPRGLRGKEIPASARIFALVDAWDALRSDRPYRAAWTHENAKAYISEQNGKHFDPKVVEAFMKMLEADHQQ